MDTVIEKDEPVKVMRQVFVEPVMFRYSQRYFYNSDVLGIRKVVFEVTDGIVLKAYALFSKRHRTCKVYYKDNTYHFKTGQELETYVRFSLRKLLDKNRDLTFNWFGLNKRDSTEKLDIKHLKIILYYLNAKFVGGYWMEIESKDRGPFQELKRPRYVKLRRGLQKLQMESQSSDDFEQKLCDSIQKAYEIKAKTVREYYGQV